MCIVLYAFDVIQFANLVACLCHAGCSALRYLVPLGQVKKKMLVSKN